MSALAPRYKQRRNRGRAAGMAFGGNYALQPMSGYAPVSASNKKNSQHEKKKAPDRGNPRRGVAILALVARQTLEVPPRLEAVPVELTTLAVVPGMPNARYWVLSNIEPLVRDALAARQREEAFLSRSGSAGELPSLELLAISGGGDKGAFGAGLLSGWTESGTRPTFKAVTGVSTGALIAPFAFLGPEYDEVLEEVYTKISPEDVQVRGASLQRSKMTAWPTMSRSGR